MEDWTDEALMRAYQFGDQAAFQLLYERYRAKIYGYFLKKTSQNELADELFQKFFLRLHEKRQLYDDRYPLLPWIFTVCHHLYVDEMRLLAGGNSLRKQLALEVDAVGSSSSRDEPLEADLSAMLEEQIRLLSPRYQRALIMRYSDGKGFQEIASSMQTTPSTARKVVNRALHHLQQSMRSKKND